MGQYYFVCNLDKREYLHPHKFGDGLKLLEFGSSSNGTMSGLAVLLADGNGRGGGDIEVKTPTIVGSWAGDRIVISGDYADGGKFIDDALLSEWRAKKNLDKRSIEDLGDSSANLYDIARDLFKDISLEVVKALCVDSYLRETFAEKASHHAFGLGALVKEDQSLKEAVFPSR